MAQSLQKPRGPLRTCLAFAVAPIGPAVLSSLPYLIAQDPTGLRRLRVAALLAYPILLILGVPLYMMLRHWRLTGLPTFLVVGLLLGILAYALGLLSGILMSRLGFAASITELPMFAIGGILTLATIWWLARPDRP